MTIEDDWLWGWDPTPGIVSVWATHDGQATVWRRVGGELVRDEVQFRPWLVVANLDGIGPNVTTRELAGDGELRYVIRADDGRTLTNAVLRGATRRLGTPITSLRALGDDVISLPPEEQYLVATGRTYFHGLGFDDLRRMQIDLETTGLDAERERIFLIAIRDPSGRIETIEGEDEATLIRTLVARVAEHDPDVIENHNLHGFDLPFLDRRARLLGVPLSLGRMGPPGLRQRAARRGFTGEIDPKRKFRFTVPGRELIDTLDAVIRYDFSTRGSPGTASRMSRGISASPRRTASTCRGIASSRRTGAIRIACVATHRTMSRRSPESRTCSAVLRSRSRGWRPGGTSGCPMRDRQPA